MTGNGDGFALPGGSGIGSVALRVGSIDRVAPFYEDVLGLDLERDGDRGSLLAGGAPLLELHRDQDAPERGRAEAGLFHVAIRVPDRGALADALARIRDDGAGLSGASDHLVSEALYLQDPEGNGVEVYRDRPQSAWPREDDGRVGMDTLRLDLDDLLGDASGGDSLPPGTDVGHVHLEVADLGTAERFYVDDLGLNVRARYGDDAVFLATDDYHHHVGLNTWNGRSEPRGAGRGLDWFELTVPATGPLRSRLEDRGYELRERDGATTVTDPDGITLRLSSDPD